jgi:hypothetical protein
MMLKRWRVVKRDSTTTTGYRSPPVWFWTRRGAEHASDRFDVVENGNMFIASGRNYWHALPHRELVALRREFAVRQSLGRHPAGRRFSDADRQGMLTIARGQGADIVPDEKENLNDEPRDEADTDSRADEAR